MLVISDTHCSVQRMTGTTPATQIALRDYVRNALADLLKQHEGEHVVCNGDFFDAFQVDTAELIKAYEILVSHMQTGSLTMIMGNHDASAKGDKVSSFHLLCHFLNEAAPSKFRMIDHNDGFTEVFGNVYAVSHCMNQDLFDLEINKAAAFDGAGKYLLLHANYKNGHAEGSSHSLNLNDDHVGNLMRAGWTLVLGHEHVGAEYRSGRVIVVGNQFPSSVVDCIGDETKHALLIKDDGTHELIETWRAEGDYIEVDWKELDTVANQRFVRVTGDATASQAADVINTIAKVRAASDALIIANAVKVEGVELVADMTIESVDQIKRFDVLSAILEKLEPREAEVVRGLLS